MNTLILSQQFNFKDDPPEELLLIKYGETVTSKGSYFFDKNSAQEVLRTYKERGLDLYMDYNHLSLSPADAEQGKASGWFELELRDEGLYAVNIKWTEKAYGMIKAKEYRYWSPVIICDKDDRVIRLINVAITNLPATDNLEGLVSLIESDCIKVGIKKLINDNAKENGMVIKSLSGEQEMNQLLHELDEAIDYLTAYAMECTKTCLELDNESIKKLFQEHLNIVQTMINGIKDVRKEVDPNGVYEEKEEMYYTLNSAKGMSLVESIKKLTGKDKEDEQMMVLTAYKDSLGQVKELTEKLSKKELEYKALEEKIDLKERTELVEQHISGKVRKLTPKQRQWALSLTRGQLDAYLDVAPVLNIPIGEKIEQPVVSNEDIYTLTESDKDTIKIMEGAGFKIDIEKYKTDKIKLLKNKK